MFCPLHQKYELNYGVILGCTSALAQHMRRSPDTSTLIQQRQQRPRIVDEKAFPLKKLLTDILSCIFEFIPLWPRFLVISRISKQWRYAALRSVKSIAVTSQAIQRALPLFPCVMHLTLPEQSPPLLPYLMAPPFQMTLSLQLHTKPRRGW